MSGYYSPSNDYLSSLFKQGKPGKRVFISFHADDIQYKTLLVEQAKSDKFDLEFTNYSINEPFDERWKTQCKGRLKQVSTTICLIGENTWSREAVAWELNTSYELGKQVFGVRIFRYKNHNAPLPLILNHSPILYWDIKDIVAELNK
jgi:hypothetical protein